MDLEPGIIERGWLSLEEAVIPEDAPALQRSEMRKAFFAGALHLFCCLLAKEPSVNDLEGLARVHDELLAFAQGIRQGN
ncbi:MAG TPA: hypothetical protein PKA27_06935 [Fimbriimonadaceae bacterium]|nr:hypothetical protein [Fimbriimonadaceae bacterium]